jgi:hypothetical protein
MERYIFAKRFGKENGCGASLSQRVDILGISEKGDVAWIGIRQRGYIGDFDIPCFRSEPGAHTPGEFTESH